MKYFINAIASFAEQMCESIQSPRFYDPNKIADEVYSSIFMLRPLLHANEIMNPMAQMTRDLELLGVYQVHRIMEIKKIYTSFYDTEVFKTFKKSFLYVSENLDNDEAYLRFLDSMNVNELEKSPISQFIKNEVLEFERKTIELSKLVASKMDEYSMIERQIYPDDAAAHEDLKTSICATLKNISRTYIEILFSSWYFRFDDYIMSETDNEMYVGVYKTLLYLSPKLLTQIQSEILPKGKEIVKKYDQYIEILDFKERINFLNILLSKFDSQISLDENYHFIKLS